MKRTLTFALSISLCLTCFAQATLSYEEDDKTTTLEIDAIDLEEWPDSIPYRYPLFQGLSVSVNIFPPVLQLFGKDYCSYEAMITLDLHNRFMPQVAAGVGSCDETSDDGLRYKTNMSPFIKAGMVYNIRYNDKDPNNFFGIFARYGFSHHTADICNISYSDGIWDEYTPSDLTGIAYNSHWMEFGGMIKVQIMKHISMGWDASFKPIFHTGRKNGKPHFVPGYGATTSKLGFGFHVYYDI